MSLSLNDILGTFSYDIIKKLKGANFMKKQHVYNLSIIVATVITTLGCAQGEAKVETPKVIEKQSSIEPASIGGTTLATLQSSGISTLALKGTKEYKENDAIEFSVNTLGKAGYLYIIYLDNKGETQLLYPNAIAPLTELSGEYIFPRDFGGMNINASKDCGSCSEDKTTIYALLTKEPISDMASITKAHLMKFIGRKSSKSQNKGLNFNLGSTSTQSSSNINVGQIEFLVK
jgi:hypothetical protein